MTINDNKNNILVSVVTPSFSNFTNFYKTIDSVLLQNYKNIEYIIADDGSSDFNEKEIKEYIEKKNDHKFNIKIFSNENNLGTVKNLNKAYKMAEGKYIINLPANDIFFNENVVSEIINRIEKDNTNVLVTSRVIYNEKQVIKGILPSRDKEVFIKRLNTSKKQYKSFILNFIYGMCSGSVLCVKNDYIKSIGYYDEKYTLLEDAPFFADTLYKEKITLATDIVSIYYEEKGVSNSTDVKIINPIFKKDLDRFLTEKCVEHLDIFNAVEKRRVLYRKYRHEIDENDKSERIKLMIKYLPEIIYFKLFNK